MTSTRHTPSCPGREVPFFRARDHNQRIGTGDFLYLRCQTCGLIRIADIPEDLSKYYTDPYYQIPTPDRLAALAAKDRFKIETVKRHSQPGRLLEIGSAWGTFAFQAKEAGYQVDAVEMDSRCCDYLNQQVGIRAVRSASPHEAITELGPHEVLAIWHVIEHLPDPWALLKAAADNLTPGGLFVLATPNPDAWQFRIMGAEWPHIDAPRHLYLMPSKVLMGYVAPFGFECVDLSSTDSDARSWNRFGWQRLLMNRVSGKWLTRAAYLAGYGLAALLAPFERRDFNGSAYTLIMRKMSPTR